MEVNVRHLMARLRQNPLDNEVLSALRQYCAETQSFSIWAEALEHHAHAAATAGGDPVELARLHFELGNLYRSQLGLSDRALAHYHHALEFDGSHRGALTAVRALCAESGDWEQVALLLLREAEASDPAQRVAPLIELAGIYATHLRARERATAVLREAVACAPDDLHPQHELATLLLEDAERSTNEETASEKRQEAAEVLCSMARAVSDDYAFAYLEAALDAVPDHRAALSLLEQIAPRIQRSDALAARWLAAIRGTSDRGLSRVLRLKMAQAYIAVQQLSDAQICLEPLLAVSDPEALALARGMRSSERAPTPPPPPPAPARATRPPPEPEESVQELLSAELMLEGEERSVRAPKRGEPASRPTQTAAELPGTLRPGERPATATGTLRPGDYGAMSGERPERIMANERPAKLTPPSRERRVDSDERALRAAEAALDREPQTGVEPRAGARVVRPAGEPVVSRELMQFRVPRDDDDVDPFAEETQPRAAPLTLAELTALTGKDAHELGLLMPGDEHELGLLMPPSEGEPARPPDSDVTQLTPAEDPAMTELRSLRTELARRVRFRDRRGAAEVAETLLERNVFDSEAIEALEEHYRLTRDFRRLRDLSMRIAREPSFSKEIRGTRLREAVMLSESKLGDPEGAVVALRELRALEPADADAFDRLTRLLKRTQRWDDLAELLEERSHEVLSVAAHIDLLRELGALHRDKRKDVARAIDAYERARELDPNRPDDEVVLSELYLQGGRYAEAATMYEARLARAEAGERVELLTVLAGLYEERLHDLTRARRALEALRVLEPRKLEPLHALLRVLDQSGEYEALADALSDLLALAPQSERARVHVRIAELALSKLNDASRAADSYGEAIALAPGDRALWQAAQPAYARAERVDELDQLLSSLAQSSRDRVLQSALYEHLAITRGARDDLGGAITAREAQYAITQDVAALSALVVLLRSSDRATDLARRLDDLARRSEPDSARTLRLERARVFAEKLRDPEAAKQELERLLSELGTHDAVALEMLLELCKSTGDTARRARTQERLIKVAPSPSARIELAMELVDIYERELDDLDGTIRVLSVWTGLEPDNPQPYLRLAPLLAQQRRRRELLDTLDKLSTLAITDEEAGEFVLRAARVAIELEDYEGAWTRLVPRIVDGDDPAARELLEELSAAAGRGEQLAALYVGLAQRAQDAHVEQRYWTDAARAFEQQVGAYDRALEAMLRALAKQLDNRELLGEVERLAERAQAWPRLAQVYDTLVRKADDVRSRIRLLVRHARLLELRAEDRGAAFERMWLAFQLDPAFDETYEEAKRLALAMHRNTELLAVYEKRAQSSASTEARIDALIEACAVAQHALEDTPRATGYLSRAVGTAGAAAPLLDEIEARMRGLDEEEPPIHGRGLLAELAGVYVQLANEPGRPAPLASMWLARAARLHEHTLEDVDAAFRTLEQASSLMPGDEALLDELYRVAALSERWEALATHLQHTAEVAIDSRSSSAALRRLGALFERELFSPSRAADAYEQLVRLRPQDGEASRRLRLCLRAAQRFEELLIAIDRELFILKPNEGKRELLKQAAEAWEFGIKNRYEALDAWKKVLACAPDDPEAVAAFARLSARPRRDESLLDEDVVVLPEDLRPSLAVAAASSPAAASLFASVAESELSESLFQPSQSELGDDGLVEPELVTTDDFSVLSSELLALSPEPERVPGEDDPTHDFEDLELTLPLVEPDDDEDDHQPTVSLEGLSELLERKSSPPLRATPRVPPPPGFFDPEDGDS